MILSPGFLEVLSQAPDLLNCQPPRLCSLESLMLEIWSTRNSLRSVAYLLKISPSITDLFLQSMETNLAYIGADWEAGLSSPEMLSYLWFVEIYDVEACDAKFKLPAFLLKNAKVLEQVDVIFSRSSFGSRASKGQVELFIKKLRAVPTASSSINWQFMRT
ncbi:uncharacterized protein LOC113283861 [Papaver somniferum]|uniref:uncharacterized protein LOC113283861 n=1 Tax=Papaver somniferum TaxID=3469 RepID=UPI000E7018CF|nr:uncharacterized protein LOC113283861 [Papaver somniferum]